MFVLVNGRSHGNCHYSVRAVKAIACSQLRRVVRHRIEHIGRLARMSVLDTEVDSSNPGSTMLFP